LRRMAGRRVRSDDQKRRGLPGRNATLLRRLTGLAAAITVVVSCVGANAASAYVIGGARWPSRTITYYDAGPDSSAVRAAVNAWNTSGANLRLVSTPRRRAHVVILTLRPAGCVGLEGVATLGYSAAGDVVHLRSCPDQPEDAIVAAHELGHVLGLNHELHRCATMNPSIDERCKTPPPYSVNCRILQPDDVQGAVSRYGGRPRAIRSPQFCPEYAPPGRPTALSVTGNTPPGQLVRLNMRVPAERRLVIVPGIRPPPGFKLPPGLNLGQIAPQRSALVYEYTGTCPAGPPHGHPLTEQPVPASGSLRMTVDYRVNLHPGAKCFAVWITDAAGRRARGPATVRVAIVHAGPTASFAPPPDITATQDALFADSSAPGDDPIAAWFWSFGDGSTSTQQDPDHIYPQPGTYTVSLTVTSSEGQTSTATQRVIVAPVPGPSAAFDLPQGVAAGQDTTFYDESIPGGNPIVAWSWSFGDGGTSTQEYPDYIYAQAGTYTVTLTVTASDGQRSSTSQQLTVTP
jgi:chitodextrinase